MTGGEPSGDEKSIGVRFVPPGFRGVLGQLAREYRVSYSSLTREALAVGIEELNREHWIIDARQAYYDTRANAMSTGDPEALTRIDQRSHYQFLRTQPYRMTLAASRETAARVAELAVVCGIHTPALGVLTVIVAVLGLPNRRGYRDLLTAEVEAFTRSVIRHTRVLRLGD
jgi:hypothetical protein